MGDLEKLPKDELPGRVRQLLSARAEPPRPAIAMANLRKVWESGITVVMGTDAGNIGTLHGPSVFREMGLMSESGLTPPQVLRTATNGAKTLGMEKDLGAVAPGRLADLILLR